MNPEAGDLGIGSPNLNGDIVQSSGPVYAMLHGATHLMSCCAGLKLDSIVVMGRSCVIDQAWI